jgi:translation initiation factor IF-2
MTDENGNKMETAGPSVPVEIIGLAEVAGSGDPFRAVADERMARELVEQRRHKEKEDRYLPGPQKVSLDDLFSQIQEGQLKDLNLIVKADTHGSVEALCASLNKMENPEVRVRVLHSGVGAINESDVLLASTAGAIVIGFHVRPEQAARDAADRTGIDLRLYRVIYDCIEEIETAMKGMLTPKFREAVIGHAEIRQTFKASGIGTIAGCYVTDGHIRRNTQVRVLRDNVVIHEGELASLKRFKDDAREVATGYECGMNIERFNDIKIGDVIEAFIMEEIKQ